MYGIGIFVVDSYNDVSEIQKAKFNRKVLSNLIQVVEQHKYFAKAGNSEGKYFSPFKQTKHNLINYVRKYDGCALKDAMDSIRHHYASLSSATASMRQWINSEIIDELYIENGKVFVKKDE